MAAVTGKSAMPKIERLTVSASYTAIKDGLEIAGRVEFVARVSDSSKGYNLEDRARKAVVRRLKVPASNVRITGVMGW